jgi:hypothetical protein
VGCGAMGEGLGAAGKGLTQQKRPRPAAPKTLRCNRDPTLHTKHLAAASGSRQQAAGSRQQAAGSRQQAAGSRQQGAGSRQQAAGSRQQAAA